MLCTRFNAYWARTLEHRRSEWARLSGLLDSLSPLKTVERGYAIVRKDEVLIRSTDQLKKGDRVEITFAKGKTEAEII
jgi:exodeoxyribonuclease VII large subunit